jgi:hypothetical protein
MTKEKERRGFGGFIEAIVGTSCWLWAIGYWLLAITYKLSLSPLRQAQGKL